MPRRAPITRAPIVIPSNTRSAKSVRITRSLKVPGSPSSALQTTYFFSPGASAAMSPLQAGGKARPAAAAQAGAADLGEHVGRLLGQGGLQAAARRDRRKRERTGAASDWS